MKAIILVLAIALLHTISAKSQTDFYAYHTKINSGEAWEEYSKTGGYADLVVQINDDQIIFHRKPCILNLNIVVLRGHTWHVFLNLICFSIISTFLSSPGAL